jgi:uncharacterized DUF497 family protein
MSAPTYNPLAARVDVAAHVFEKHGAEEHWFPVGCASNGAVLSVVYLWSDTDPVATNIRLISARKSTQAETWQYQEGL